MVMLPVKIGNILFYFPGFLVLGMTMIMFSQGVECGRC